MTLNDVLNEYGKDKNVVINWRVTTPLKYYDPAGEFFGYCEWKDGKLNSLDGDDYSLDAEIVSWDTYEVDGEEFISVIEAVEWYGEDTDE